MIEIVVDRKGVIDILDIVKELRASGLRQGVHFDFAYNQSRWDGMIGNVDAYTVFTFYEEKYATLFALKYSSCNCHLRKQIDDIPAVTYSNMLLMCNKKPLVGELNAS